MTELRGLLIMVLVVGMVSLGLTSIYAKMAQDNNMTTNKTVELSSIAIANDTASVLGTTLNSTTVNQNSAAGLGGTAYIFISQGVDVALRLLSLPQLFLALLTDFTTTTAALGLGVAIPSWFTSYALAIVSVVILAAVVYFLVGRQI